MIEGIGFIVIAGMLSVFGRTCVLAVRGENLASDQAEADAVARHVELVQKTEGRILCLRRDSARIA